MEHYQRKSVTLNSQWINKSLEYHGQPLQKVWEGEHGNENLSHLGIQNPDYSFYQSRQRHFVFQDRAKRLKIHSFIAKKANELFSNDPAKECAQSQDTNANNMNVRDSKGESI